MTQRIAIVGTGLSGLVGSKITEQLQDTYTFENLDLSVGVDITNQAQVEQAIAQSPAEIVIHLAAFTDLNAAEEQKGDKNGLVYKVNVEGTRNIAQACQKHNKYLIHISTGYVFDGQKKEAYTETDTPNPIDWYGHTKLEAEQVVQELLPNNSLILRINFPYRQDAFPKPDLWHKMVAALEAGKRGPFFADHFYTLTPIEWLTEVIEWAFRTRPVGVFHATTDTVYTDYLLAQEVAKTLGITEELEAGNLAEYNKTAARPYAQSLILSSQKLAQARQANP